MTAAQDYKPFTGIGSRTVPPEVKLVLQAAGDMLAKLGYTLRSGGADGSDSIFEEMFTNKEIFLPWRNFNGNQSPLLRVPQEAFDIASKHHPAWSRLPRSVHSLMARSVQQVMGESLDHLSKFVVCYTADGCEAAKDRTSKTGGTGLAISVASSLHVPIFNLKNPDAFGRLNTFLDPERNYGF